MKKNVWIHLGIVAALFAVACIFMSPALEGKEMVQGDSQKWEAMAKEQLDLHEKTGDPTIWNSSMFSGMPGYQITTGVQTHSVFVRLKNILNLQFAGWGRDIGVLFLYFIGFYICLLALGAGPWMSLLGALAFGLGSYNIIIIEAGHITKAWSLAMMAPILAGMVLLFRHKWLWGGILFTLSLGIQIAFNHIQITYYTMLAGVILGVVYAVFAVKEKEVKGFLIAMGILLAGSALAIGGNATHLFVNQEYSKYTMRGGNDITVTPEDLYHDSEPASMGGKNTGLDIDYAFSWSYGVGETYTLLVPGSMGGGSGEKINTTKSAFYNEFRSNYGQYQYPWGEAAPLYWGNQPFTSGPVYFGAIIIFLFVLGCLVVKGPERWWLIIATVLALLMSWGSNFMAFNEFLFNHLPMYNKFRTPSMSLVIANVTMVVMAVLALKTVMDKKNPIDRKVLNRSLYIATGVLSGLILVVLLMSGSFNYAGASDQQLQTMFGSNWETMKSALVSDRAALLRNDSWRSLTFVLLAAIALWLYVNEKVKKVGIIAGALTVLVIVDLWRVDRRYLDENNFSEPGHMALHRNQTDDALDALAAQNGDVDYRVFDLSVNTFNDSRPSAFHHQIGGYHAAKLRRYQDIIDFYLSRHINMGVLNMLNARYIVMQNRQIQRNPEALGNCWFVNEVKLVQNANEEILALNELNPATTAVVNSTEFDATGLKPIFDSTATIVMEHQQPYRTDYVKYRSHSASDQLAVFSEVYYSPDWRAYIDGKPAEYIRANYILRAMVIPAGDHVIEFRCEAPTLHRLITVNIIFGVALVIAIGGGIFFVYRKKKK